MIINFHISGESWTFWQRWNTEIEIWPQGQQNLAQKVTGENVYYNPPEEKAKRLVFSNKIDNLSPDTLYKFRILYNDFSTKNREIGPIK